MLSKESVPPGARFSFLSARVAALRAKVAPAHKTCLDSFMERDAHFIEETLYVAGHMRHSCRHALWRVEELLSKLENGESLNTRATTTQLAEAREELRRALGGIEHIEKLCEPDS